MDIKPFKGRSINKSFTVRVHRNLHNGLFSVVQHGLVVGHASHIVLSDCSFMVNEAGRQRVLREKRKNVHAFIVGYLANNQAFESFMTHVSYNPYKGDSFVTWNGDKITKADFACANAKGLHAGVTVETTLSVIEPKLCNRTFPTQ